MGGGRCVCQCEECAATDRSGAAHLMATDQASRTVRAAAASAADPNAAWKALRRASPLTCRWPQAVHMRHATIRSATARQRCWTGSTVASPCSLFQQQHQQSLLAAGC